MPFIGPWELALILGLIVVVVIVLLIIGLDRRDARALAKFKERMIAAFKIPRLFGYDEGECLVCGGRVDWNQSQAQVRLIGNTLRIVSASNLSVAEIYFPPHSETKIAHLRCVSWIRARRIEAISEIKRFSSSINEDGPSRYVVFYDFETEKYYWGFFPPGWRPGDKYHNAPFSITQPEILVEYLLAMARRRL